MSYRIWFVGAIATALVTTAIAADPTSNPPGATAAAPTATTKPGAMAPHGGATTKKKEKTPAKAEKKVDLNNATLAELKTLPSVSEEDAKKIVANRPYVSKTDLVTRAGLPEGVYQAVRYKVVVNDMKKPSSKATAARKTEPNKPVSNTTAPQK